MVTEQTAKKILVIHYSQTGQLDRTVESIAQPLVSSELCEVNFLNLEPETPYPFPWPFITFINAFPEAVHEKGCALKPMPRELVGEYDLIILGYQVWYLAPSNPITALLQSPEAEVIFKDTPVITTIACRNMWLLAQERVKKHLTRLGAKLIGNVALVDEAGAGFSFLSTPIWMFSGSKGPYPLGIPNAGVAQKDIKDASRFGKAVLARISNNQALDETVLRGLGAVKINVRLVASERIATRSFHIWGKLFLACGQAPNFARSVLALLYAVFLIAIILTVVPINFLVKKLLSPFTRKGDEKLREYFAAPSGE